MTLNKREKTIAIAVGSLFAVLILYYAWPSSDVSTASLLERRDSLNQEVRTKDKQILQGKKTKQRLADMQSRALPEEKSNARTLYQSWLLKLADGVKLQKLDVSALEPQSRKIYTVFSFNVTGRGTLEQLVQFLHAFYAADHLHKISSLSITPVKKSSDLDLQITIEALSLPGSMQKDKLSDKTSKRLKLDSLEAYKKTIVNRNLFAAYSPPKPATNNTVKEEPKSPPKVDPLQYTILTAIIEADGIPEAWLSEKTTGKLHIVHEGDDFTIGKVHGKVNRIGYNEIEIEIDGKTRTVTYGNSLKM
jgi:hypothetical protein